MINNVLPIIWTFPIWYIILINTNEGQPWVHHPKEGAQRTLSLSEMPNSRRLRTRQRLLPQRLSFEQQSTHMRRLQHLWKAPLRPSEPSLPHLQKLTRIPPVGANSQPGVGQIHWRPKADHRRLRWETPKDFRFSDGWDGPNPLTEAEVSVGDTKGGRSL